MNVLELYSGIGGMHMALKCSGVSGTVKTSIDINPVANSVYQHNFPETTVLNRNIQSLTPKFINGLEVDAILMSPPCQPFTRNGLQGDIKDQRTVSFLHILNILPELRIERILIENVKGFESSLVRNILVAALEKCGFIFQEFLISPTQVGVPNTRLRYYCIARRRPGFFSFEPQSNLMTNFPSCTFDNISGVQIGQILDNNEDLTSYHLPDNVLRKYAYILDICYFNSTNSCCFTKAYGRYVEGTGSVYTSQTDKLVESVFKKLSECDKDSDEYLQLVHSLNLRYFTPKEVSRLMSFPETFSFPENLKNRQKYMLLGNSINVKVVAELIKLLK